MERAASSVVSVIIPTYNRAKLLAETIRSCLDQTYPHVEVIVVDDGSTDTTPEVLAAFAQRFPAERFRYASQANRGPSAARNRGLRLARGEFVKFMDDDDTLEEDALDHYVRAMKATNADLGIGGKRYMSPEGRKWPIAYRPPAGLIDRPLQRFFDLELRPQQGVWCFRRTLFDSGTAWDETLLAREDTDLLGRLLVRGAAVVGVPEAILNQRYHGGERQTNRQFEGEVFRRIHESNCRLYELMVEHGRLKEAGRSFARSLCRTALRMWEHDREAARQCCRLAKRAYWWPELVLLDHYPRSTRIAAYALWALGGLGLCGPLMQFRARAKRKAKA
jgi:glycosyltransferase involved in cell wall biosynthesis